MNIVIINGGNNNENDPACYTADIIADLFKELDIDLRRIDLYKQQYNMPAVQLMMQEATAVVFLTTVEWVGIGKYMQEFLDTCWEYDDHSIFADKYCLNIVLSKCGEQRIATQLISDSWYMLSGMRSEELSGCVGDDYDILSNEYKIIIERKIQDFYRILGQKRSYLPNSGITQATINKPIHNVEDKKPKQNKIELNEKEEKDILEISNIFKNMLNNKQENKFEDIREKLLARFDRNKAENIATMVQMNIEKLRIILSIKNGQLICLEGEEDTVDIMITISDIKFNDFINGELKLHMAFQLGILKVKGNMSLLNTLDECFSKNID